MTPEIIKKKKEDLVIKHNTLKDKIEEGKIAIRNMEAQLNGLVGAVQLCDDLLNNPEEPKKRQMMDVWDPKDKPAVFSQIKTFIIARYRGLRTWVVGFIPGF